MADETPLIWSFPPGTLIPVFCVRESHWTDGWTTVTFADRSELEECVFASRLALELGLIGRVVERGDGNGRTTRVEMV